MTHLLAFLPELAVSHQQDLLIATVIAVAFLAARITAEATLLPLLRRALSSIKKGLRDNAPEVLDNVWIASMAGPLEALAIYTTFIHNEGCTPLNAHACFDTWPASVENSVQRWYVVLMFGYYGRWQTQLHHTCSHTLAHTHERTPSHTQTWMHAGTITRPPHTHVRVLTRTPHTNMGRGTHAPSPPTHVHVHTRPSPPHTHTRARVHPPHTHTGTCTHAPPPTHTRARADTPTPPTHIHMHAGTVTRPPPHIRAHAHACTTCTNAYAYKHMHRQAWWQGRMQAGTLTCPLPPPRTHAFNLPITPTCSARSLPSTRSLPFTRICKQARLTWPGS